MQSIYLKFYLTEKQKFGSYLLHEWILEQAKHIGISYCYLSYFNNFYSVGYISNSSRVFRA